MTPERWQRLKPLYNAALDLSPQSRNGFLEDLCAQDKELGAALEALLASNDVSEDMLDTPVGRLSTLFSAALPVLLPGTLLAGRFRIVRHLGSGGMGDVYEAQDEAMEQGRIALKTVRPHIASNPAALARFKDEVRLARQVSGPNVCRIHELYLLPSEGNHNAGGTTAFLTMELLEGETLHERIAKSGALKLPEMRRIAEQLCTALCCIHVSGIVHGDLKPRNVMLVAAGATERVVVTDFGLARAVAGNSPGQEGAALVAGTPSYMAPEQFEGQELTPATDVYALGVMLYEMATGVQPYAAHTPLAAAIRRSKTPVHASVVRNDLPAGWDDVIARCLRYDAGQRFQSAEDVEQQLAHPGKVSLRLGPKHRLTVPLALLWTMCAGVVAILCLGGWLLFLRPRHRELAPDAARWYALGMTALREGSYLKATRLLTMVTQRDGTYALAHAALADAWTELDFTGAAQQEMLLAASPEEQRGLNEVERRYIDAVRSTLIRDYSAAAQDYEAILRKLPDSSKAEGYVDLGRIYEKAGKLPETLASYQHAAQLNPDDPAPFLHLGILRSRQREESAAAAAFNQAEQLYTAEGDLEGLAEVSYQRGYAANDREDDRNANGNLNRSLAIARQIPSVQLEVRSLAQLSSVAYNNGKDDIAIELAQKVIDMAEAQALEYWVTDGLVRLGNAQLDKERYDAADVSLQDALRRAGEHYHPRLQATASLSLASLRSQQQRPGEAIRYARQAFQYFQDYGFLGAADQCLTLIARAQESQGQYGAALATGRALLGNLERKPSPAYQLLAEELVGGVLARLQRYPEALLHYDRALEDAAASQQDSTYLHLGRADVLSQLGRVREAELALSHISAAARMRVDVGSFLAALTARIQLMERDARGAAATAEAAEHHFPGLASSAPVTFRLLLRTASLAEAELGHRDRAQQLAGELGTLSNGTEAWEPAASDLTQAVVCLRFGDSACARARALSAETYFAHHGLSELDATSLLVAAQAARAQADRMAEDDLSHKSVDTFRHLAEAWGVPAFRQYLTRPDRLQTMQSLAALRMANGDRLDPLFQ